MTQQTSCIPLVPNDCFVMIRAAYLTICDGNHCAAALLSFFEHGHNHKLEEQSQAKHRNRIAENHGDEGVQDETLLQWQNQEQLEEALLGLYKRVSIRGALKLLEDKGFLSIHKNPNPRYKYDQTRYFLFHPEEVIEVLDFVHETKIAHLRDRKATIEETKIAPTRDENSPTRSQISSQITSQKEEIPYSPLMDREQNGKVAKDVSGALEVLSYLNTTTGRHLRTTGLIPQCLKNGSTVEECLMVIDWWKQVKIREDPTQDRFFDHQTLFRPANFDKYLAMAEVWQAGGRKPWQAPSKELPFHTNWIFPEPKKQGASHGSQ